ncbi:TOBE domain-containing protein [Methylomicrobium sp. RS1]|uniref:TOBE domain-containing protein n=1 Tax=Candidatus Methylomicrobium oryzae TaxID=2802053 RepID=UPI0019205C2B|nr:TOBE domain-containing protein [Methylomicrobium sp. RS1]MBL1265692.1 TOBE domain-containing protein [Methylomicrobium sp. RS1]
MNPNDKASSRWIEGELRLAGMLDARMIELLKAIDRSGSINQAAKQMGLSYKGAWQMLERANNGAPQTLLTTAIGGSKGGGTALTASGKALLALFTRLEQKHREFIAELNRSLAEDPDTILLLQRLEVKTSTRNQLFGQVTAIGRDGADARITVRLKGGEEVVSSFSTASLDALAIGIGADAVLMINSADIMLLTDPALERISARNRLFGKVMRIQHDIVDSEVIVLLPSGEILAAMITQQSLRKLALMPGMPVWAVFKAHAPILGVRPS